MYPLLASLGTHASGPCVSCGLRLHAGISWLLLWHSVLTAHSRPITAFADIAAPSRCRKSIRSPSFVRAARSRRLRYGRLLPRYPRLLPCRANVLHCAPSSLRSRGRPRRRHSRASFTVAHFAFCSPRSDRKALQSLSLAATLPSFAFPLRGSANAPSGLTAEG